MQLDPAEFLSHVDGLDMSREAKIGLIETVLRIAEAFVDLAWGTAPEQTVLWISDRKSGTRSRDPLDSIHPVLMSFNAASEGAAEKSQP